MAGKLRRSLYAVAVTMAVLVGVHARSAPADTGFSFAA